ncbi:hypothetical protein FHG87_021043 [Trinorchestia longiramus]|nr:hypothetical protein FHG87_021043 [Trinorchestia longiramus]
MESNQNTEKASKAITRYCKECKATYSLQLFNIRGRLATTETNQKQNYEQELQLQSPETELEQHLPTNNQPQQIKIIDKRSNFYLKTKNRFNALKDEMENINSTKEQTTQISNEHNPKQIQSHTQPAGIRVPEAGHLVEDLRCTKGDIVIVLCRTRDLEHETQDEIFLQFETLIHKVKNKSKNA